MINQLIIADHTGDTVMTYDPTDTVATAEAADRFVREVQAGAQAYKLTEDGPVATRTFDPLAGTIVLTEPMIGG